MNGCNSRMAKSDERIGELKDITGQITQSEKQRENRLKNEHTCNM